MKQKKKILLGVSFVLVAMVAFMTGSIYNKSHMTLPVDSGAGQFRGARSANGGRGGMGGFSGGQVVSIDATSITVVGRDGSSKIVLLTSATPVMEMVAGKISDITVGKDITVVGQANPDGSISASSIQIRPMQKSGQSQIKQ